RRAVAAAVGGMGAYRIAVAAQREYVVRRRVALPRLRRRRPARPEVREERRRLRRRSDLPRGAGLLLDRRPLFTERLRLDRRPGDRPRRRLVRGEKPPGEDPVAAD